MWTKVYHFRENWNYRQNSTRRNFFVFELWPTNFGRLVVLLDGFTTVLKYLDKSLPVSRKWGPHFKFLPQYLLPQGVFGGNFVTAR